MLEKTWSRHSNLLGQFFFVRNGFEFTGFFQKVFFTYNDWDLKLLTAEKERKRLGFVQEHNRRGANKMFFCDFSQGTGREQSISEGWGRKWQR